MNAETFTAIARKRAEEIKFCIQENDIDRASKRLIDFTNEFSLKRPKHINESMAIRSNYKNLEEQIRRFGYLNENKENREKLIYQILDLVDLVNNEITEDVLSPTTEKGVTNSIKMKSTSPNFKINKRLGKVILECKNLTYKYPHRKNFIRKGLFSLENISLEMKSGEMTGLVGLNGSGKTTLLELLSTILIPNKGIIHFPQFSENEFDWYSIKEKIAYISQEDSGYRGNLKQELHFLVGIRGIVGEKNVDEVNYIIHRLGLEAYFDRFWEELSTGYKLRFRLARALICKPSLLILDEPLAHLDINTQQTFLQDIKDLANSIRNPLSVIISSQHLFEIEAIADRILFLKDGISLFYGNKEDLRGELKENLFELNADISYANLIKFFKDYKEVYIQDTATAFLLNTSINVSGNEILNILINSGIKINYFRDISLSTRKLFNK